MPSTKTWGAFLKESDAELRRGEWKQGLTWTPEPGATTPQVVAEYVEGFAWNGIAAREIVAATGRDERWVKRALADLVDAGKLRVEEQPTRGKHASKRKVYFTFTKCPFVSAPLSMGYNA